MMNKKPFYNLLNNLCIEFIKNLKGIAQLTC